MNGIKKFGNALLIATAMLLIVPLAGCASTPDGGGGLLSLGGTNEINLKQEAADWSEFAAGLAIRKEPASRLAIQKIADYMDQNTGNGQIDLPVIRRLVTQLEEMQSPDAQVAVFGGTFLLRKILRNRELQTPERLSEFALGIREGLKLALEDGSAGTPRPTGGGP